MSQESEETTLPTPCLINYVGSFVVAPGLEAASEVALVRRHLTHLRDFSRTRPVLLLVSVSGIKMCSLDGKQVFMAHALKRIAYATCDPDFCQFAFLAKEPRRRISGVQYCHIFRGDSKMQTEEIHSVVSKAFRAAYSAYQEVSQEEKSETMDCATPALRQDEESPSPSLEKDGEAAAEETPKADAASPTSSADGSIQSSCRKKRKPFDEVRRLRSLADLNSSLTTSSSASSEYNAKERATSMENGAALFAPRTPRYRPQRPNSVILTPYRSGDSDPTPTPMEGKDADRLQLINRSVADLSMRTPALNPSEKKSTGFIKRLFGSQRKKSNEENPVFLRSTGKERRRRPMSELFSVRPPIDLPPLPRSSPANSVKSLCVNKSRRGGTNLMAMDAALRRSANLEQLFRVKRPEVLQEARSSVPALNRLQPSPGGTGCGDSCQFIGLSPETAFKQNCDYLLPIGLSDEKRLQSVPWFAGESSRDEVVGAVRSLEEGAFVVRRSATHRNCLALTVRVPSGHNIHGVSHYLILRTTRGYKLKGFAKEFPSVQSLVTHHSIMAEQLPCRLKFVSWSSDQWCQPHKLRKDNAKEEETVYGPI